MQRRCRTGNKENKERKEGLLLEDLHGSLRGPGNMHLEEETKRKSR
jgi:hypothetical protein